MPSLHKRLLVFYALIVCIIVGLIFFVHYHPTSSFDNYVSHKIQELTIGNFTSLMKFISIFGDPFIAPLSIIFTSLLFFLTYNRREGFFTLTVIIADLFNILIKIFIHRPRPTLENAQILLKFTQSGFPSGHVVHCSDARAQKYFFIFKDLCWHPFCLLNPRCFNLADLSWRPLGHRCYGGIFIRFYLPGNHP